MIASISRINRPFLLRWLVLAVAGWLAYTLVRAIWILVRLDTPMYDWQWYVPLSVLLVVLTVHLVWRWHHTRITWGCYAVLVVWAIGGYHPPGSTEYLLLEGTPPVAVSFWAFTDLRQVPDAVLEDVRDVDATLYLSVRDTALMDEHREGLIAGLRRLQEYGIPVVLHPDVSDFLSAPVYQEWSDAAQRAAELVQQEGLTNVRGIIGDAEKPRHASLVPSSATAAQVTETTEGLGRLIETIQRDYPELQIGVTASWALYLDGVDGDNDLAFLLQSPVDPPGGWSFVNVMAYSSYFPHGAQAYMVASTERGMAARYPHARGSYLIGLVGGGFPWEPLNDFDDLVRDGRISRARGADEIVVFQLNGALEQFGAGFVQRFNTAVNGPQATTIAVPFSRLASLLHYGLACGDALLDIRGPGIWPGAGWLVLSFGIVWWHRRTTSATIVS